MYGVLGGRSKGGSSEEQSLARASDQCNRLMRQIEASIEHAEVLRRLEQELLAFKLDTETKLTEEARKLSGVVVDQRKIGEGVELAAADSTLTRLKEVEHALLKEREGGLFAQMWQLSTARSSASTSAPPATE